jgi:hypothetical protein
MRSVLAVFVGMLAGCSGETPPNIDANPLGPRCSKQVYDLCAEEHDCTMMVCQNFAADGLQVCSQGCATGLPCPKDRTGVEGTCVSGVCKPSVANMCHL